MGSADISINRWCNGVAFSNGNRFFSISRITLIVSSVFGAISLINGSRELSSEIKHLKNKIDLNRNIHSVCSHTIESLAGVGSKIASIGGSIAWLKFDSEIFFSGYSLPAHVSRKFSIASAMFLSGNVLELMKKIAVFQRKYIESEKKSEFIFSKLGSSMGLELIETINQVALSIFFFFSSIMNVFPIFLSVFLAHEVGMILDRSQQRLRLAL